MKSTQARRNQASGGRESRENNQRGNEHGGINKAASVLWQNNSSRSCGSAQWRAYQTRAYAHIARIN